jgi:hypothetical protein
MVGKPVISRRTALTAVGDLLARLDDFRVRRGVELKLMRSGEERTVLLALQPGI